MSLGKYFTPKDGLANPKGPISQSLPSRVIPATNSEVAKTIAGENNRWHQWEQVWRSK